MLKPGGVVNGFEVPFPEGAIEREAMVLFNTWGYDWQVSDWVTFHSNVYNFIFRTLRDPRVRSPTWASMSSGPC